PEAGRLDRSGVELTAPRLDALPARIRVAAASLRNRLRGGLEPLPTRRAGEGLLWWGGNHPHHLPRPATGPRGAARTVALLLLHPSGRTPRPGPHAPRARRDLRPPFAERSGDH